MVPDKYGCVKVTEKDEVETVVVETKTVTKFEPSTIEQLKSAAISAVGCFAGIGALSTLHYDLASTSDYTIILGSMGATAVLVFGAPAAPFSQPFNVIVGHAVSAACGIAAYQFIAAPMGSPFLALPVAAAASMFSMQMGKCVHPPAGGTALIAVLGSPHIHALGYVMGFCFPSHAGIPSAF